MRNKISFTIEEKNIKKFNALCAEIAINKSALIEKLILQWINENKK